MSPLSFSSIILLPNSCVSESTRDTWKGFSPHMHISFQWVGSFLKKTIFKRRKKQTRVTYLVLQPLEEAHPDESVNAWLPQSQDPIGGIPQPNQTLQLFRPVSGSVESQLGLKSGAISLTGTVRCRIAAVTTSTSRKAARSDRRSSSLAKAGW